MSQKIKDYITIWNTGVSFIYFACGAITIVALIMTLQLQAEYAKAYGGSYSSLYRSSSMSFGDVMSILFSIVMFVAGVTNLFYARKYLRDDNPKSPLGWVATISLAASNIYLLIMIIEALGSMQKSYSSYGMSTNVLSTLFLGSSFSWVIWLIAIVIVFNAVAAVIGFINMIKWSPMTIDSVEGGGTPAPIAADVATHAMGYSAPAAADPVAATETQAPAAPAQKDLPPMLNADPDAPVQQPQSGIRDEWTNPGPTTAA